MRREGGRERTTVQLTADAGSAENAVEREGEEERPSFTNRLANRVRPPPQVSALSRPMHDHNDDDDVDRERNIAPSTAPSFHSSTLPLLSLRSSHGRWRERTAMERVEWRRRGRWRITLGRSGVPARARRRSYMACCALAACEWREGERDAVMESDRRVVALFAAAAPA